MWVLGGSSPAGAQKAGKTWEEEQQQAYNINNPFFLLASPVTGRTWVIGSDR